MGSGHARGFSSRSAPITFRSLRTLPSVSSVAGVWRGPVCYPLLFAVCQKASWAQDGSWEAAALAGTWFPEPVCVRSTGR